MLSTRLLNLGKFYFPQIGRFSINDSHSDDNNEKNHNNTIYFYINDNYLNIGDDVTLPCFP